MNINYTNTKLERISIIAAIIVILTSLLSETLIHATQIKFSDVLENYQGKESIYWALDRGIIKGYPDGRFRPSLEITEKDFVVMLARFSTNVEENKAKDNEYSHWSQVYYDELRKYEIPLKGYNDDKAKDELLTRGDIARITAAKNGFNLTEEQAIYYMFENDLTKDVKPNIWDRSKSILSFGKNRYVRRDQITELFKVMESKNNTTFMGRVSDVKGSEIKGIVGVPQETKIPDFSELPEFSFIDSNIDGKILIEEKAEEFLEKYEYSVHMKVYNQKSKLEDNNRLVFETSKDIGLNLEKYKGKEIFLIGYELKGKSKNTNISRNGIIAYIYYNEDAEIIGAYLVYEGYAPGIVSLNDKRYLRPESFEPSKLEFTRINKVEIIDTSDYSRREITGKELDDFLKLFKDTKSYKGNLSIRGSSDFAICFYYEDETTVILEYYEVINKLVLSDIDYWYYEINDSLSRYIKG
ncbi:S-layer-like domain-containing protein [Gottschalkia acidurici 9a]|uniref:S-layer-like domain-containing protein n=1 Tax=Gottschalkia acidurici (strain ATCC 7906 / DSM 604 / BCRC 14475 / CIP 104303 / KCTC 5404 / NCIMB 10678 / 9a) TaxID=1128398 RepID=K0B5A2_GOTA9|nr:DUF4830 domain-containing protein [Gottschalkia acidurici]AFS79721.1 S-layer-like domain-containing protein [Gottschalkia acidurici 9a]